MWEYIIKFTIFEFTFFIAGQSATFQTQYVEKTEFSELQTVLNTNQRNILTEFHEIRDDDINFFLVTQENPHPVQLNDRNLNLVKPERMTKFIIGGWMQNFRTSSYFSHMINAYLGKGDYNIIIVDNYNLVSLPRSVAIAYTQPTGYAIARFAVKLQQQAKISFSSVHMIAHSLGGLTVTFAGKEVTRLTGLKIRRITGLDVDRMSPIRKNDAEIVDLIHTTAVVALTKPAGTINFYPNGGNYNLQPGCTLYPTAPLKNITDAANFVFCSHHKSYEYFVLTINSTITAVKCKSYSAFQEGKCNHNELAVFGDNYAPGPHGKFYLYLNCSDTSCVSSNSPITGKRSRVQEKIKRKFFKRL